MAKAIDARNVTSASDTQEGVVELATATETATGTDTLRVVTPSALAAITGKFNDKAALGQVCESIPRWAANAALAASVTGVLYVVLVDLHPGQVINSLTWNTRTTGVTGGNNQWSCVLDLNRVVKAVSPDDTSNAWGINSPKTFTMTSAFNVDTVGAYYFGLMVNATTPPSLLGFTNTVTQTSGVAPKAWGVITSAVLTTPPTVGSTVGSAIANQAFGAAYVYSG